MKNYLIALLSLFFVSLNDSSFGQSERYIEVHVTDTITLKATGFTYSIEFGSKDSFLGIDDPYDYKDEEDDDVIEPTIDELVPFLTKDKFQFSVIRENDYSVSNKGNKPSIHVTLKNIDGLKRIYKFMLLHPGYHGSIIRTEFESISLYYDDIFKDLTKKARLKAGLLAKVSQSSLGSIISISEINSDQENPWSFYEEMLKKFPFDLYSNESVVEKTEYINMRFKFELK